MWLSIALIIVLIIVLLIALLIGIIMLTPITYSFVWNGRSPYQVDVKVQWLWRVLLAHVSYFQGKPLYKELYLLGKQRVGPIKDYEDWLEQQVEDEYNKAMDEADNDPMAKQAEAMMNAMNGTGESGQGPTASTSPTSQDDVHRTRTVTVDGESSSHSASASDGGKPDSTSTTGAASEADPTKAQDDEVLSKVSFNADGSMKEKVFTKFEAVKSKVQSKFEKPDPNDPVASFKSEIPTFWFMKHVTNTDLWYQLLLVSKRCMDHSKPGEIEVEGRIGLGDPYKAGILAAMIYSIWPNKAKDIEIEYVDYALEGSGHIKGRIVLGVLAFHGTRFIISKPMRALLAEAFHVIRVKLRERKQLKKLKEEQAAKQASNTDDAPVENKKSA